MVTQKGKRKENVLSCEQQVDTEEAPTRAPSLLKAAICAHGFGVAPQGFRGSVCLAFVGSLKGPRGSARLVFLFVFETFFLRFQGFKNSLPGLGSASSPAGGLKAPKTISIVRDWGP